MINVNLRLQLGDQQYETKVIPSTLNPKWRESFEFRYLNTSGNTLQVLIVTSSSKHSEVYPGKPNIVPDALMLRRT